uniref:Uncharacterized protein n=1 Tax=Aegilops tauschii subsp. strangulata TaxID=200361 RepID=A0A453BFK3_AEGTS
MMLEGRKEKLHLNVTCSLLCKRNICVHSGLNSVQFLIFVQFNFHILVHFNSYFLFSSVSCFSSVQFLILVQFNF